MIAKKLIINIGITSFSIITGILISEYFAKRLGLGNPLIYNSDPLVGYRLKPNQSKYRRNGSLITTDSEGFRIDPKVTSNKDTNFFIFVGDSVTYGGSYIDNYDLFSSKYCELLNKNFNCLNNGLNAWGVLNMGRFIANFKLYSKKAPSSIFLVILPGDEQRNLKSLSDTPFWDYPPKQPSAINEIISYLVKKIFLPSLKNNKEEKLNNISIIEKNKISSIQRKAIWNELTILIKESQYPINIIITPPKKWFNNESYRGEIKLYDDLIKEVSKLKIIKNSCNLYHYINSDYHNDLYVDGVHLSKKGHDLWARKLLECTNYSL